MVPVSGPGTQTREPAVTPERSVYGANEAHQESVERTTVRGTPVVPDVARMRSRPSSRAARTAATGSGAGEEAGTPAAPKEARVGAVDADGHRGGDHGLDQVSEDEPEVGGDRRLEREPEPHHEPGQAERMDHENAVDHVDPEPVRKVGGQSLFEIGEVDN